MPVGLALGVLVGVAVGVFVGVAVGLIAHISANDAIICPNPASVAPEDIHVWVTEPDETTGR